MEIKDLKNVRLSKMTAGYLAIYLKLSDLFKEASEVTELDYSGFDVDVVNKDLYDALHKAQDEVMKLASLSISANMGFLNNSAEI